MGDQSSGDDGNRGYRPNFLHDLWENQTGEDLQGIWIRLLDDAEPHCKRLRVQDEYSLNGDQPFFLRALDEMAVRRDDPIYPTLFSQKTDPQSILSDPFYEIDVDKDQLLVSSRLFNDVGKIENRSS